MKSNWSISRFWSLGLIISIWTVGCVKADYFGRSGLKQVLYITAEKQSGVTRIVEDSLRIYITVSAQANLNSLAIDSARLSTFATITPAVGAKQNFSGPVVYTVTAEDGSQARYTVIITREASEPQLINSGFDDWYTPSGKNYQEPGKDDNTIWASANAGVVTTGASNYNTRPYPLSGTDLAAELVTKDLGPLAQITNQRIGSATLFTGKFVLNLANPPLSAQFGVPFTARPTAFTVDCKYTAGTPYKDGRNNTLSTIDSADIYVLLENRSDPNAIKRIATGWSRLATTTSSALIDLTVPLIYGVLPAGTPTYKLPANGLYGSSTEAVTHISVVFASSARGIFYEGGVNSTLLVNNFALLY